jgi:hypothetical protein
MHLISTNQFFQRVFQFRSVKRSGRGWRRKGGLHWYNFLGKVKEIIRIIYQEKTGELKHKKEKWGKQMGLMQCQL